MIKMIPEVLEYLKTQRIGVLAVEMLDGSPHAATVHYANTDDPLVFYFETYREYRKTEPLFGKNETRASFVVGCNESNMKTLQIDGVAQVLNLEEKEKFAPMYLDKFPEKLEKSKDPKFVFFKFTPTWWRFTDWTTSEGKKIWQSK